MLTFKQQEMREMLKAEKAKFSFEFSGVIDAVMLRYIPYRAERKL